MADLTVYEKPTCTTCRKLAALLTERGIDFDSVEYHVTGLTELELRDLLAKAGARPHDVLRRRAPRAKELDLDALGDDALKWSPTPSSSSARSSCAATAPS